MWGMAASGGNNCPNCGAGGWSEKKGHECRHCGFKIVDSKEMPEATLIFCEGCACHYLDKCTLHPTNVQKPRKL